MKSGALEGKKQLRKRPAVANDPTPSLAVGLDRTPLGVLAADVWVRPDDVAEAGTRDRCARIRLANCFAGGGVSNAANICSPHQGERFTSWTAKEIAMTCLLS